MDSLIIYCNEKILPYNLTPISFTLQASKVVINSAKIVRIFLFDYIPVRLSIFLRAKCNTLASSDTLDFCELEKLNKYQNVISSTRSMLIEIERKVTISREKYSAVDFAIDSYDLCAIIVARLQLHASFHVNCRNRQCSVRMTAHYITVRYIYEFALFCIKFKSFSYTFVTTQPVFL